MKKIVPFLVIVSVAFIACFAFFGFPSACESNEYQGKYYFYYPISGEIKSENQYIELMARGELIWKSNTFEATGTYKIDGETITVVVNSIIEMTGEGTIKAGKIELSMGGTSMYYFKKQ